DDPVSELEQARHIARTVLVIERNEGQVAPRRIGSLQLAGGQHAVCLAFVHAFLRLARIEIDLASGPSARNKLQELGADKPGRSNHACSHRQAPNLIGASRYPSTGRGAQAKKAKAASAANLKFLICGSLVEELHIHKPH